MIAQELPTPPKSPHLIKEYTAYTTAVRTKAQGTCRTGEIVLVTADEPDKEIQKEVLGVVGNDCVGVFPRSISVFMDVNDCMATAYNDVLFQTMIQDPKEFIKPEYKGKHFFIDYKEHMFDVPYLPLSDDEDGYNIEDKNLYSVIYVTGADFIFTSNDDHEIKYLVWATKDEIELIGEYFNGGRYCDYHHRLLPCGYNRSVYPEDDHRAPVLHIDKTKSRYYKFNQISVFFETNREVLEGRAKAVRAEKMPPLPPTPKEETNKPEPVREVLGLHTTPEEVSVRNGSKWILGTGFYEQDKLVEL